MEDIKSFIENEFRKRLDNVSPGLFSGMKPSQSTVWVQPANYVVYSTFSVDVDYRITIPIKLLGENHFSALRVSTRAEAPVTDVPEFIRNVNMVEDYLIQTGTMDKIQDALNSVKNIFKK